MGSHQKWVSLIVLAAGKSTRFGSNKLLFKLDGETLIERVVRTGLESKANEVVVVLGYKADRVREALRGLSCRIVLNSDFETGQSSSVVTGVKSVKDHADAALILPGDVALVRVEYINRVIDEYNSTASAIVVASYQGKMGHPILIGAELFDEVLAISEETFGLKALIKKYRSLIKLGEVVSNEILFDVDTQDDLKRIVKQ